MRNQERKYFMENNSVNTLNVEKYRLMLEVYGVLLGKELYSVKVINADPKYNEKSRIGAPVPMVPIKLYIAVRHNIVGVNIEVDGTNTPVVILKDQKGNDIRCRITKPEFKEVSVASVREAVEAYENKSDTLFFSDCEKLTKELTQLNIQQRSYANDLAKEMAGQASLISETIEQMKEQQRRYYESLNRHDGETVTASLTITE